MAALTLHIDKEALYNSLKVRNIRAKDISNDMGFTDGWLSDNISRGKGELAKWIIDILELKYDIPYTEYSRVPEPEPMAEDPVQFEIVGTRPEDLSTPTFNVYIKGFSKEAMDQLAECFYEALARPSKKAN